MSAPVLIDGRPETRIDVRDRGLQYGDGLFETIAVRDGRVRRLEAHLHRLERGCTSLAFTCPPLEVIAAELRQLADGQARAVLKLIVTRGSGSRGYRPPAVPTPVRILWRDPWPEYPEAWQEQGVQVRFCRSVLGDNPALAGIKHLNRLEQVLARAEWSNPEFAEGLMLDVRGAVVCGTMTNVFAVTGGVLRTPRLDRCGVLGTMRQTVIALARTMGMDVEETELRPDDVLGADELFLTNALIGIWPVRQLEQRGFEMGPVVRRLQQEVNR